MADVNTSAVVQLIKERRERPGPLRRRISMRAAAMRAGDLSGEPFPPMTWTRIETGQKEPDDRQVVIMAAAVNDLAGDMLISPGDLDEAGRPEAAQLYREWIREQTAADSTLAAIDPDLTPVTVQHQLQAALAEIRSLPGVSPAERAQMEKVLLRQLDATIKAHSEQLRILKRR